MAFGGVSVLSDYEFDDDDTMWHQPLRDRPLSEERHLSYVYDSNTNSKPRFRERRPNELRKPVLIDGYTIGRCPGRNNCLNVKRMAMALRYFYQRGHQAQVFLIGFYRKRPGNPEWFDSVVDRELLETLERLGLIQYVVTPPAVRQGISKRQEHINLKCQIVAKARDMDGLLCSTSNFQDVLASYPDYESTVKHKVLSPTFADNDTFYLPLDGPLGRWGVGLEQTLCSESGNSGDVSCERYQLSLRDQYCVLKKLDQLLATKASNGLAEPELKAVLQSIELDEFVQGGGDATNDALSEDYEYRSSPPKSSSIVISGLAQAGSRHSFAVDRHIGSWATSSSPTTSSSTSFPPPMQSSSSSTGDAADNERANPFELKNGFLAYPQSPTVVHPVDDNRPASSFNNRQVSTPMSMDGMNASRDSGTFGRDITFAGIRPGIGFGSVLPSDGDSRWMEDNYVRRGLVDLFGTRTADQVLYSNPTVNDLNELIDIALAMTEEDLVVEDIFLDVPPNDVSQISDDEDLSVMNEGASGTNQEVDSSSDSDIVDTAAVCCLVDFADLSSDEY